MKLRNHKHRANSRYNKRYVLEEHPSTIQHLTSCVGWRPLDIPFPAIGIEYEESLESRIDAFFDKVSPDEYTTRTYWHRFNENMGATCQSEVDKGYQDQLYSLHSIRLNQKVCLTALMADIEQLQAYLKELDQIIDIDKKEVHSYENHFER